MSGTRRWFLKVSLAAITAAALSGPMGCGRKPSYKSEVGKKHKETFGTPDDPKYPIVATFKPAPLFTYQRYIDARIQERDNIVSGLEAELAAAKSEMNEITRYLAANRANLAKYRKFNQRCKFSRWIRRNPKGIKEYCNALKRMESLKTRIEGKFNQRNRFELLTGRNPKGIKKYCGMLKGLETLKTKIEEKTKHLPAPIRHATPEEYEVKAKEAAAEIGIRDDGSAIKEYQLRLNKGPYVKKYALELFEKLTRKELPRQVHIGFEITKDLSHFFEGNGKGTGFKPFGLHLTYPGYSTDQDVIMAVHNAIGDLVCGLIHEIGHIASQAHEYSVYTNREDSDLKAQSVDEACAYTFSKAAAYKAYEEDKGLGAKVLISTIKLTIDGVMAYSMEIEHQNAYGGAISDAAITVFKDPHKAFNYLLGLKSSEEVSDDIKKVMEDNKRKFIDLRDNTQIQDLNSEFRRLDGSLNRELGTYECGRGNIRQIQELNSKFRTFSESLNRQLESYECRRVKKAA